MQRLLSNFNLRPFLPQGPQGRKTSARLLNAQGDFTIVCSMDPVRIGYPVTYIKHGEAFVEHLRLDPKFYTTGKSL